MNNVVRLCLTAGLVVTGGFAVSSTSAQAVGGNCSSSVQKKDVPFDVDPSRVRASCSSLQADSKADGVLDRSPLAVDGHTGWFTQLNTYKYSGYYSPPIAGSYVRIAHV